jgi:hypothetical protein
MGPDLGVQSGTVPLESLGCGLCIKTGANCLQPEWVQVYTLCRVLIYTYSRVLGYGHFYVLLH